MSDYPTDTQRRLLWNAVTAFAAAALVALAVFVGWLLIKFLGILYPVLLPLGLAAIIAFILEPVTAFLEKRGLSRRRALVVIALGIALILSGIGLYIIPPLISQIFLLFQNLPHTLDQAQNSISGFLADHPEVQQRVTLQVQHLREVVPGWIGQNGEKVWQPVQHLFGWLGFALGFLFVPLYVYYFLEEQEKIEREWKDYVPLQQSWWRDELVVVLSEINKYLIVFFRGQVLIGLCLGTLTAIGLMIIGLPYALLIGLIAGTFSIIPYLGVVSSLVPALLIAYVHSTGWTQPLAVLVVFGIVQFLEGFVISPRILGDRTGLHPLTVIISILTWSLFLPGLLGPILAVPLTATLRVLMYRYVWLQAVQPDAADPRPH